MPDAYNAIDRQAPDGDVTVLRLSGDLDINARAELRDAITGVVDGGHAVEVDMIRRVPAMSGALELFDRP